MKRAASRPARTKIYLGGSIIPRSLKFSASSPARPRESRGSSEGRKQVRRCFQRSASNNDGDAWDAVLVDLALVLYDHVLLVDGLQESRGQRLEVGDGLRRQRQAAAVFFREQQLLHCAHVTGLSFCRRPIRAARIKDQSRWGGESDLVWWTELLSEHCCFAFRPL